MPSRTLLAPAFILLSASALQAAEDFPIASNGAPAAAVVISSTAPPNVVFAANELAYHLGLITGTRPALCRDQSPPGLKAIRLGDSPEARAAGFDPAAWGPQEYAIEFRDDCLFLIGNDGTGQAAATPDLNQDFVPKRATGRFGRAPAFDGNDFLQVIDAGANSKAGTVEFWLRPDAGTSPQDSSILRIEDRVFERKFYVSYLSVTQMAGTRKLLVQAHEASSQQKNIEARIETGPLDSRWHHIRIVWDSAIADPGARMQLFVDGKAAGSAQWPDVRLEGRPLHLGGWQTGYHEILPDLRLPWKGQIDDVRISSVARRQEPVPGTPHLSDEHTSLLLHLDENGPDVVDSSPLARTTSLPRYFDELGTLYAVYDFLERHAGVRWYAPTETGIVFNRDPSLAVPRQSLRRSPSMPFRLMPPDKLFLPGHTDQIPLRETRLWQLRMRMGGEAFIANHSFNGYTDLLLATHPELFAIGQQGKKYRQLNWSSPEVLKRTVDDARRYFNGDGLHYRGIAVGDSFSVVPMDSTAWSLDKQTQSEINRSELENEQFSNGKYSNHWFGFVNRAAAEIARTHPGKRITTLAYSDYALAPDKVRLLPNVDVSVCLHTRNWWVPAMERADRKIFGSWRAQGDERRLYVWLYDCFPVLMARGWHCFPGFYAKQMIGQMRWLMDAPNLRGFFVQHAGGFRGSFLLDQVEAYIRFRMMWDRQVDPDALYDGFFSSYYGPAAPPMKDFYRLVEETYTNPENYPGEIRSSDKTFHQTEEIAWGWLGTAGRMTKLEQSMLQAERLAATEPYKTRVAWFRNGIWDYMCQGRSMYLAKQPAKNATPPP